MAVQSDREYVFSEGDLKDWSKDHCLKATLILVGECCSFLHCDIHSEVHKSASNAYVNTIHGLSKKYRECCNISSRGKARLILVKLHAQLPDIHAKLVSRGCTQSAISYLLSERMLGVSVAFSSQRDAKSLQEVSDLLEYLRNLKRKLDETG